MRYRCVPDGHVTVRDGSREVGVDDDTAAALDARASLEAWHDMADAFAWQDSVVVSPPTMRIEFGMSGSAPELASFNFP